MEVVRAGEEGTWIVVWNIGLGRSVEMLGFGKWQGKWDGRRCITLRMRGGTTLGFAETKQACVMKTMMVGRAGRLERGITTEQTSQSKTDDIGPNFGAFSQLSWLRW